MKDFILSILPKTIRTKVLIAKYGYNLMTKENHFLYETGYTKSHLAKKPITKEGELIPWMNYAIINFLQDRLNKNQNIFEYGSGFSSIFYAKKVNEICSVEYDENWKKEVEKLFIENSVSNAIVIYNEVNEEYPKSIATQNKKYEIIIVDGRKRVKCAKFSIDYLTENGVLILDDSSREYYKEVFDFYKEKGFKELTFCGIKPSGFKNDFTTIFYRPNNCFNI